MTATEIAEVVRLANVCLSFLADLNGGGYLKADDVATVDMAGRAKSLQRNLYNILRKEEIEARSLKNKSAYKF